MGRKNNAAASRGAKDPALSPISPLEGAENGRVDLVPFIVLQPASAGLLSSARGIQPRARRRLCLPITTAFHRD
jgi:hypothetical protein